MPRVPDVDGKAMGLMGLLEHVDAHEFHGVTTGMRRTARKAFTACTKVFAALAPRGKTAT